MSRLPALSLFSRLTRRKPRPARALEPADMGTAFGMEQWLDTPDGRASGEAPAAAAGGSPAASRRPRWLPSAFGPR